MKNILLMISAQERHGLVSEQKEVYRIGQYESKNIGILDTGKNLISGIPINVTFTLK